MKNRKSLFTGVALLSSVIVSPALAGTIFPPANIGNCQSGAGMLSWNGQSGSDVQCKTIPVGTCPTGQVVLSDSSGLRCSPPIPACAQGQVVLSTASGLTCGSPIGACSGTQMLTTKSVGSTVVFSCEDISSRVTIPSCAKGYYVAGISGGKADCQPLSGTTTPTTPTTPTTNAPCGTYTHLQSWSASCPQGTTGTRTLQCNNGTISEIGNSCTTGTAPTIPTPTPTAVSKSCVNAECSGTGPVVMFPVANAAGQHIKWPSVCSSGSYWVDTRGNYWSGGGDGKQASYCSGGGWVFQGNCAKPEGGNFANCPAADIPPQTSTSCVGKWCTGINSIVSPARTPSGAGFASLRCPGYWWMDMRTENITSYCDGLGNAGTYGTGWVVVTP